MHLNLPEAHRHHPGPLVGQVATPTSAASLLVDAQGWSHHWRKGGPMLLAELTSRWSHVAGGRQRRAGGPPEARLSEVIGGGGGRPLGWAADGLRQTRFSIRRSDRHGLRRRARSNAEVGSGAGSAIGDPRQMCGEQHCSRYSGRYWPGVSSSTRARIVSSGSRHLARHAGRGGRRPRDSVCRSSSVKGISARSTPPTTLSRRPYASDS